MAVRGVSFLVTHFGQGYVTCNVGTCEGNEPGYGIS